MRRIVFEYNLFIALDMLVKLFCVFRAFCGKSEFFGKSPIPNKKKSGVNVRLSRENEGFRTPDLKCHKLAL